MRAGASGQRRTLLLFVFGSLDEMLAKGNVWYVRHYEAYFDAVWVVYLLGRQGRAAQAKTTLVGLGTGRFKWDLLWAPLRLYRFARAVGPTTYLTADLFFSWWTAALARLALGAGIFLIPVCIPEQIYKWSGRSVSGLPVALERLCVRLSFRSAHGVLAGRTAPDYVEWLAALPGVGPKLRLMDFTVEELPSPDFYAALESAGAQGRSPAESCLLYVGRLHREKLVGDLIDMLSRVHQQGVKASLTLIGDGPERANLEDLAARRGVRDQVEFLGAVANPELVPYYRRAAAFVSPYTGTCLPEAGLCGTPVVAYEIDWGKGFLRNGENALLVAPGDTRAMADQVVRLLTDRHFRETLAARFHALASDLWARQRVARVLEQAFGQA